MQARKKLAVAGATGRVGRHVVHVLEAGGHDVVAPSSPSPTRPTSTRCSSQAAR